MSDDAVGAGCAVASLTLFALAGIGWCLNIIKIFDALGDPVTGMFIGRVVGAFIVPIGCIVGWL